MGVRTFACGVYIGINVGMIYLTNCKFEEIGKDSENE